MALSLKVKLIDEVVSNCLDISLDRLEAIKSKIPLTSFTVLEDAFNSLGNSRFTFIVSALRLVMRHVYYVVIYTVLYEKFDLEAKSLKNKKKIPQLEKATYNQVLNKFFDICCAVDMELYMAYNPR